jgi:hypothetical protein
MRGKFAGNMKSAYAERIFTPFNKAFGIFKLPITFKKGSAMAWIRRGRIHEIDEAGGGHLHLVPVCSSDHVHFGGRSMWGYLSMAQLHLWHYGNHVHYRGALIVYLYCIFKIIPAVIFPNNMILYGLIAHIPTKLVLILNQEACSAARIFV